MRSIAAFIFGVVVLAVTASYGEPHQYWHSYLVATLFFSSVGLGALFFVLVHTLARAGWHVVLRRQAEHVMATIPVTGVLMIPLFFHLDQVYPWVTDPVEAKVAYLNTSAFVLRGVFYLVVWSLIAWWFRRQSMKQDHSADFAITHHLQMVSAPALIVFGASITFAAFDWLMSLDPHWYSSIFGVYFFAGAVVAFFAFQVLLSTVDSDRLTMEHFHGLGKFLFGFVCFWAYIAFSQYLLIWYASIPEETLWYRYRFEGTWFGLSSLLALGHFVLPFFFFLPVRSKTSRAWRAGGAIWLLGMHYLDLYWVVLPGLHPRGVSFHWSDLATMVGVALVFGSALSIFSSRSAAVPESDPRLAESLAFKNA